MNEEQERRLRINILLCTRNSFILNEIRFECETQSHWKLHCHYMWNVETKAFSCYEHWARGIELLGHLDIQQNKTKQKNRMLFIPFEFNTKNSNAFQMQNITLGKNFADIFHRHNLRSAILWEMGNTHIVIDKLTRMLTLFPNIPYLYFVRAIYLMFVVCLFVKPNSITNFQLWIQNK